MALLIAPFIKVIRYVSICLQQQLKMGAAII